jgi:hypothetical protein
MQAGFPISMAIHRRPSRSATAAVVPEPEKKSAIMDSPIDDELMILSNRDSGFWVP